MKKYTRFFFLLSIVLSFASCKEKSPHELINAYIEAVEKNDSASINKYYNNSSKYWTSNYNTFKANASKVKLPKTEVMFSDTATHVQKVSIVSTINGKQVFWNIEKGVKQSPIIASTYGLVSLNIKKIKKDFGLESFNILTQTDDATITAVEKLGEAINCVKHLISNDNGSFTEYAKKIGIENCDCYVPKEFKEVDVYIERNPDYPKILKYHFTIGDFKFLVKCDDGKIILTNTKGIVDHSTLVVDPGECWDAQLNDNIAEYNRTAPYREAGVAFSKFDLPLGTLWSGHTPIDMKGKNYSNKTIKYLEVTFVALNSVGDIVTTDRYQRQIMVKGIGPIEPGETFSYSFRPSWGIDSRIIDRVVCIGVCSRYTDGTFKASKFIMEE